MFPESQDNPSAIGKFSVDPCIPFDIPVDFLYPEIPIFLWFLKTLWTFIPVAAIDKDCNFLFCKDDIWFSRERIMNAISSHISGIEHLADLHLRGSIFSSDCSHVTASLFRDVDVGHSIRNIGIMTKMFLHESIYGYSFEKI